jgi:anti-sigma B factor antagonist
VIEQWVTFDRLGEARLVRLAGEIDLANTPAIGRAIVAHTTESAKVLIDLTSVSFLDSAGIRLLDALVGDLHDLGTPIRLVVGERGPARMSLQLSAFRDDVLAADLERAAAELSGRPAYPGSP